MQTFFSPLYRDGQKGMQILLSNSCLVLPAVVKQQLEEISRNHVPTPYLPSLYVLLAQETAFLDLHSPLAMSPMTPLYPSLSLSPPCFVYRNAASVGATSIPNPSPI